MKARSPTNRRQSSQCGSGRSQAPCAATSRGRRPSLRGGTDTTAGSCPATGRRTNGRSARWLLASVAAAGSPRALRPAGEQALLDNSSSMAPKPVRMLAKRTSMPRFARLARADWSGATGTGREVPASLRCWPRRSRCLPPRPHAACRKRHKTLRSGSARCHPFGERLGHLRGRRAPCR